MKNMRSQRSALCLPLYAPRYGAPERGGERESHFGR